MRRNTTKQILSNNDNFIVKSECKVLCPLPPPPRRRSGSFKVNSIQLIKFYPIALPFSSPPLAHPLASPSAAVSAAVSAGQKSTRGVVTRSKMRRINR